MKVLIYPFSTEIAFEIYHSLEHVKNIELYGGADNLKNHGQFVFKNIVTDLPFISDDSSEDDINAFEERIKAFNFDLIYPAMDGVIYKFAQYRKLFKETVIVPDFETASITRSKAKTYAVLQGAVRLPKLYESPTEILSYPIFVKPDVGQGSVGAKKIYSKEELDLVLAKSTGMLILEYLPGDEYTVDCFTNNKGELVSVSPRKRLRMKNGISMACEAVEDYKINEIASKINERIHNKGGWFFQLKKNSSGEYVLLEVASRVGGTSAFTRVLGINLPLLTVNTYCGQYIDSAPLIGHKNLRIDRSLGNSYKTDLIYDSVYTDYDDTLVVNGHLNIQLVSFLYHCVDKKVPVYLLSRHDDEKLGKLNDLLERYHITSLFTEILHIGLIEKKSSFIKHRNALFIDDSYGERISVKKDLGITVLDPSMVEGFID